MWSCKVKLGLFGQDLAVRFNISISTVSRTIITGSNLLNFTLGCLRIAVREKFCWGGRGLNIICPNETCWPQMHKMILS